MKLKLQRNERPSTTEPPTGQERVPLRPGMVLGRFTEASHRIEVLLSGEHRLWLRTLGNPGTGDTSRADIGPIAWNVYRTPSLDPVPQWFDSASETASLLVFKAMALYRVVVSGEPVDPALGLEVNPELGYLVYQSESAST